MSPPFSKFAESVGGSTVVGMRHHADALEAGGMSVVDFGIGEPDFDVPPPVRKAAIQAIHDGRGNYIDPRGLLVLREAIAQFEADMEGRNMFPLPPWARRWRNARSSQPRCPNPLR